MHSAIDAIDVSVVRLFDLNAHHAHDEADQIVRVRRRASWLGLLDDAACVLLTGAGLVVTMRAARRQRPAEAAHEQAVQERADELAMFAKRVAHDLLNPLASVSFSLSSLLRALRRGEPFETFIERANANLARTRQLVHGALKFARSGARVPGGGTADVFAVMRRRCRRGPGGGYGARGDRDRAPRSRAGPVRPRKPFEHPR